ncbi:hypothetical protein L2E82_11215 [Cichorium intybus]|uniref:Uncharacterized protein n=1 Tax=Cichorium intybus TaxID=13427 RepID=A0ACB9GCI4_CICIN|nr:hypothetical protein L2E82_11215 [Cichorium intybus]
MLHWCSRAVIAGGGGAFVGEAATAGASIAGSNNAFASTCSMAVESSTGSIGKNEIGDDRSEEDDTLNQFPDFVMVLDVCMERETVM